MSINYQRLDTLCWYIILRSVVMTQYRCVTDRQTEML